MAKNPTFSTILSTHNLARSIILWKEMEKYYRQKIFFIEIFGENLKNYLSIYRIGVNTIVEKTFREYLCMRHPHVT